MERASGSTGDSNKMLVLALLTSAQFVMVIDSTVMNVSIASLVHDLHATVTQIQYAITLFTLVMAASMITGGKLGDIFGRRRAFRLGLVIYAMGSGLTAISQNINMLYLGWSVLEGLGAALILPTVAALVASNFKGQRRAVAYGVIAAAASAAMTLGPLVGGFVTTMWTWRYVFAAEVVICMIILASAGIITDAVAEKKPKFDAVGAALTAGGMASVVFGVLMASSWGWVTASASAPVVGPLLGLSPTVWLVLGGLLLLWLFLLWEQRRVRRGQSPLVDPRLFGNQQLTGGLTMLAVQMFIMAGTLFALPVFLSISLGMSAFDTGLALMPLSIGLIVSAVWVSKALMKRGRGPRAIVRAGLVVMLLGTLMLAGVIEVDATARGVALPLLVLGLGFGLLAGQLGNVIQSSVPPANQSEAGGLQYTAQNIGTSLGTALIGAILISALAGSIAQQVTVAPALTEVQKQEIGVALDGNVQFVTDAQLERALSETNATPEQTAEIISINAEGRIDALRRGMSAMAFFIVIALFVTGRLPTERPGGDEPALAETG